MNQSQIGAVLQGRKEVVLGALGAALMGAVFALEFERLAAIAGHLILPAGRMAVLQAVTTAVVVALGIWMTGMVIGRAIRQRAVLPYLILTDQMEARAERSTHDLLRAPHQAPDVQRLTRAILTIQDELVTRRREVVDLGNRYDALCEANSRERESLMAILMEKATGRVTGPVQKTPLLPAPSPGFTTPDRPAAPEPVGVRLVLQPSRIVPADSFGPVRLSRRVTTH